MYLTWTLFLSFTTAYFITFLGYFFIFSLFFHNFINPYSAYRDKNECDKHLNAWCENEHEIGLNVNLISRLQ